MVQSLLMLGAEDKIFLYLNVLLYNSYSHRENIFLSFISPSSIFFPLSIPFLPPLSSSLYLPLSSSISLFLIDKGVEQQLFKTVCAKICLEPLSINNRDFDSCLNPKLSYHFYYTVFLFSIQGRRRIVQYLSCCHQTILRGITSTFGEAQCSTSLFILIPISQTLPPLFQGEGGIIYFLFNMIPSSQASSPFLK